MLAGHDSCNCSTQPRVHQTPASSHWIGRVDEKPQGTFTADMFKELCATVSAVQGMVQGQGQYCGEYGTGAGSILWRVCCRGT